MEPLDDVERRFRAVAPSVDFWSLRIVSEQNEYLSVRRGVVQPLRTGTDIGAMVTVYHRGGMGYAGTSELTADGLARAAEEARAWAERTAGRTLLDVDRLPRPSRSGAYESQVRIPWSRTTLTDKIELLRQLCDQLGSDPRIVDRESAMWHTSAESLQVTSEDVRIHQRFSFILPTLSATANAGVETHTRTFGGHAYCRQGGLEVLDDVHFATAAPQVAEQALELLAAPNCPSGTMDLVLAPDQMILQIHESIGHPLEIDRILGDERNYAGTSFVTPDMFGSYRYGSDLLNITFDPTRPEELATYGFDDEGRAADREYLIKDGMLLRGLGGSMSQARSGLPGVANSRATSWNRAPIDRMSNLNLEPGMSSLDEIIGAVEHGVYMETNCSWSIDDSRNKFQFGCEWARRIENGRLAEVVKKPNYRGVSATFWRSLAGVGDASTVTVLGTPYCGKGEPNQVIRVGHAAPPCLFRGVEVFGGA